MKELHSTITSKGQVTVPVEIRRLLRIGPHDKLAFVVDADQVKVMAATSVVARTAGMLRSGRPRLSSQDERVAAEEAIGREGAERGGR